ncbi:hypothetical protein ACU4GG_14850 [Streptomyces nojiriensis]
MAGLLSPAGTSLPAVPWSAHPPVIATQPGSARGPVERALGAPWRKVHLV